MMVVKIKIKMVTLSHKDMSHFFKEASSLHRVVIIPIFFSDDFYEFWEVNTSVKRETMTSSSTSSYLGSRHKPDRMKATSFRLKLIVDKTLGSSDKVKLPPSVINEIMRLFPNNPPFLYLIGFFLIYELPLLNPIFWNF